MTILDKFRLFGLDHCDLPTILWNVAVMLRVYILNIDSNYKKKPPLIYYIFTFLCLTSYFYVYFASIIYYVGWRYRETQDTMLTLILLAVFTSSEIGNTKYLYMFFSRKTLVKLIDDYRVCDSTVPPDSRMQESINNTLRGAKRRAIIFWLVIMGNGFIYLLKPLVTPGRGHPENGDVLLGLDPVLESPNYEIAWVALTFGVIQTCFVPANATALFIVLVGYTEAQMTALSDELLCLWSDASKHLENSRSNEASTAERAYDDDSAIANEFVKNRLKELIERHSRVILLMRRLEKVFRFIIAVEFLLLVAGLICELLGGLENTYIYIPYAVMQVFMDCLSGQRLMDASIAFEDAVYSCRWENFNADNMKTVAIMLGCSQRSLTLSAGGVTALNFSSFMSIIRSVYSAYATLRRVVKY